MKIVMTGPAGIVGSLVRPFLAETFEEIILLSHRTPCRDLASNEIAVRGDIQDRAFCNSLLEGVDGLIHLAGLVGDEYTWDQVMGPNVNGTYNLFESARINGVKQIVYASSHHAVGFLPRGSSIDEKTPVRADSWYGVSKAFGEVLAAFFCDKFAMNIVSIRIGSVNEKAVDERRVHTWHSPRDMARLFTLSLTRKETGHRVVYGISDCPEPFFDNRSAQEIGYHPLDSSLEHLSDPALAGAQPDFSDIENFLVGGYFATTGMTTEAKERLMQKIEEKE